MTSPSQGPEAPDVHTARRLDSYRSKGELLARIAEINIAAREAGEPLRQELLEEREALRQLLRKAELAQAAGETTHFDPRVAQAPLYTQAELEALFAAEPDLQQVAEEVARRAPAAPKHALRYDTYVYRDGRFQLADPERLGLSAPRVCLGAFIEAMGRPVRAARLVLFEPTSALTLTEEQVQTYAIPLPTPEDNEEIATRYQGRLERWQQERIFQRVRAFAEEMGMLPFFTTPSVPVGKQGAQQINTYTVSFLDEALVREICEDEGSGVQNLHYLQTLFSTALFDAEGRPDYRVMQYVAVEPEVYSAVAEMIGLGAMMTEDGKSIADGSSIRIVKDRPRSEAELRLAELGCQFRACELSRPDDDTSSDDDDTSSDERGEGRRVLWLAKGTDVPVSERLVRQAVDRYEETVAALYQALDPIELSPASRAELARLGVVPPEPAPLSDEERLMRAEELRGLEAWGGEAYDALRWALSQPNDVLFLVKGDQIKVRPDRATRGAVLYAGTYLRGKDRSFYEGPRYPVGLYCGGGRLSREDEERFADLAMEKVYLCHVRDEGRLAKPVQYLVKGNSQLIQFFDERATPFLARFIDEQLERIYRRTTSLLGIASLVSEMEKEERLYIEHRLERLEAGEELDWEEVKTEGLDTLKQLLRSGLVRLDQKGMAMQARGEWVEEGHLAMPAAALSRIDALVASRVRRVFTGMGITGLGYLHQSCEDSLEVWRRINGLERTRIYHQERLDEETSEEWEERPEPTPVLDASLAFTPHRIALAMNADCDGDITSGRAALVDAYEERIYLEGPGRRRFVRAMRVLKAILSFRYPAVDLIPAWAVSPEIPTPWDAETEEEERSYALLFQAAGARFPQEADYRRDVVMATLEHGTRLADTAKDAAKKKLKGPVTLEGALRVIARKVRLNSTGRLTRRLERFAVLLAEAKSRLAEHPTDLIWNGAYQAYLERSYATMKLVELQLTAFKYDLELYRRPDLVLDAVDEPVHRGGVIFETDRDVSEYLPLSYHVEGRKLRLVLERFQSQRNQSDTCLETLCMRRLEGYGKETAILNAMLRPTASGRYGALSKIVRSLKSIQTSLTPFVRTLKHTLDARYGSPVHVPADVKAEAREVVAAFNEWTDFWNRVYAEARRMYDEAPPEEIEFAERRIDEYIGHAATAIRVRMQAVGRRVSAEAIQLALYTTWRKRAESPYEHNGAAALALIEGRIGEVFPEACIETKNEAPPLKAFEVFTKGRHLPGAIGAESGFDAIEVRGHMAIARRGDEYWPLYPKSEHVEMPPRGAVITVYRMTDATGILRYRLPQDAAGDGKVQ